MPRYFIEVSYKGNSFSGFQLQDNADTIQGAINAALKTLLKVDIETTTASRTDAGVHAFQNYLHFDFTHAIFSNIIYKLNAILHHDILVRNIYKVAENKHSRFDAISREYDYFIIQDKNPFLKETSYFHPLPLDLDLMNKAAIMLKETTDFSSFAKRHSDVNNFNCTLDSAIWTWNNSKQINFHVVSNRFLRGMVRALVGTQLLVGRKKISLNEFEQIIRAKDCTKADFSAPAHGLFLSRINYPVDLLQDSILQAE